MSGPPFGDMGEVSMRPSARGCTRLNLAGSAQGSSRAVEQPTPPGGASGAEWQTDRRFDSKRVAFTDDTCGYPGNRKSRSTMCPFVREGVRGASRTRPSDGTTKMCGLGNEL